MPATLHQEMDKAERRFKTKARLYIDRIDALYREKPRCRITPEQVFGENENRSHVDQAATQAATRYLSVFY